MKNLPLHWKIIIGMFLGILFGLGLSIYPTGKIFISNFIKPFGTIFINLLKLIAIPLILASLIKGVSDLKDISTASETFVISPHAGTLKAAYSIIDGAITGGDAVLTIKIGGSSAGTITIANAGSAAKDVDSNTALSTAVAAGQAIEIETNGGSTNTRKANITLVIER